MAIPDDSFQFSSGYGSWNSLTDWGIMVNAHDFVAPEKRQNKRRVPRTNGMYTTPGKYYNERILRIDCTLVQKVTRYQVRKIMGALSNEGRIQFCDEAEDKVDTDGSYIARALYYQGAMYSAPALETFFDENVRRFTLEFICYPFALGAIDPIPVTTGSNAIRYRGTYESPFLLVLDNISGSPISNITITAIKREV